MYPGLASARCDSHSLLHPAVCTNTPWSSTEPRAGEFRLGSKSLDPEGRVMAGPKKLPLKKMGIFPHMFKYDDKKYFSTKGKRVSSLQTVCTQVTQRYPKEISIAMENLLDRATSLL